MTSIRRFSCSSILNAFLAVTVTLGLLFSSVSVNVAKAEISSEDDIFISYVSGKFESKYGSLVPSSLKDLFENFESYNSEDYYCFCYVESVNDPDEFLFVRLYATYSDSVFALTNSFDFGFYSGSRWVTNFNPCTVYRSVNNNLSSYYISYFYDSTNVSSFDISSNSINCLPQPKYLFANPNYKVYYSKPIYDKEERAVVLFPSTLVPDPVPTYQNVIIENNGSIYWTPSDNSLLRGQFQSDGYHVLLTLHTSSDHDYTYPLYPSESSFQRIPGLTSYPGVSNIAPGGLYCFNITNLVGNDAVSLTWSGIYNVDHIEDFANNIVYFTHNALPNYDWQFEILYQNFIAETQNISTPVSQGPVVSTYWGQLNTSGTCYILPPFDPGGTSWDWSNRSGLGVPGSVFINNAFFPSHAESLGMTYAIVPLSYALSADIALCNGSVDLIHLQQNLNMNLADLAANVDCIILCPNTPAWLEIDLSHSGILDTSCVVYGSSWDWDYEQSVAYQAYYFLCPSFTQKLEYYVLADGIPKIYDYINSWGSSNIGALKTVCNGLSSAVTAIQTLNGTVRGNLGSLLDIDFSGFHSAVLLLLANIDANLELIESNTDIYDSHGHWYESLWNFVNLFRPSDDDFSNGINALSDAYQALPEVPSITPVPALPSPALSPPALP